MAIIFNDTFQNAGAAVNLDSHTPNTGTAWALALSSSSGTIKVRASGANNCGADSNRSSAGAMYTCTPTPAIEEYDIVWQNNTGLSIADTVSPHWVIGRYIDNNNFYGAGRYASALVNERRIFKVVSGTVTEIGSANATTVEPQTFKIRNATKKMFNGSTEVISSTDNALTAAGSAGLAIGNQKVSTDNMDTGWQIIGFSVNEIYAACKLPLMGCG